MKREYSKQTVNLYLFYIIPLFIPLFYFRYSRIKQKRERDLDRQRERERLLLTNK